MLAFAVFRCYNNSVKYLEQTFSYIKKHIWLPAVIMTVPAVVACFLSTPYWEVAFVAGFDGAPYKSVGDTFHLIFGDSWKYIWPAVLVSLVQIFGAAFLMSVMDRHFRTGRLSFRSPLTMVNNSVFPIAVGVVVMGGFSVLWRFVLFGLVSLIQVSAGAMALPAGVAVATIAVVAVGMFVIHVIAITPMLFWAPIMFIYGYKFRDAAASSFKLIAGKKLYRALLLPMIVCAGLQLLVGFLQLAAWAVIIINFAVFLLTNSYVAAFIMLTFYDISELDRRDLKPYQIIDRSTPDVTQTAAENKREDTEKKEKQRSEKSTRQQQKPKRKSAQKRTVVNKARNAVSPETEDKENGNVV